MKKIILNKNLLKKFFSFKSKQPVDFTSTTPSERLSERAKDSEARLNRYKITKKIFFQREMIIFKI